MATTTTNTPRLVLVTGAAGRIGTYFAQNANKQKYKLRLMVHPSNPQEAVEAIKPYGEVVASELENVELLIKICEGVDTILHLAGNPVASARWDTLLRDNIEGTYNIFLAAKKAGVKRVIYASSIHAVSGYPKNRQVRTDDPVNPGDIYGVTKCFGEALGRYMAEQEGVSTIAVRIAAFQPISRVYEAPLLGALIDAWLSDADGLQLFEKCIDAPLSLKFAIVHGLSRNTFSRMDINSTCELLGYDPKDNFFEANDKFKELNIDKTLRAHSVSDAHQKSTLRDKSPETEK